MKVQAVCVALALLVAVALAAPAQREDIEEAEDIESAKRACYVYIGKDGKSHQKCVNPSSGIEEEDEEADVEAPEMEDEVEEEEDDEEMESGKKACYVDADGKQHCDNTPSCTTHTDEHGHTYKSCNGR